MLETARSCWEKEENEKKGFDFIEPHLCNKKFKIMPFIRKSHLI